MEFELWTRRPTPPFKAVLATKENLEELAKLCEGRIETQSNRQVILLPGYNDSGKGVSGRPYMVFPSDWVIETRKGYRSYKNESFQHHFVPLAKSITCPKCGTTSYHPKDISERYCGRCRQYHDDMEMP